MPFKYFEEATEDEKIYLLKKYKTDIVQKVYDSEKRPLNIIATSELMDLQEYLWGILEDDVYLFKGFIIVKGDVDGEWIPVKVWGTTRIIPWPDSSAFRLI